MLELIVKASSSPDSIVMDCFCGSGTTLVASMLHSRRWIGIDKSDIAIETTKKRIAALSLFENEKEYEFLTLTNK